MNATAGGNLLTKTPRDALTIIENKSKVRNSLNKPIVTKVSTNAPSSTPHSPEIAALVDAVKAMVAQKSSPSTFVKAVEEICVTCGGPHPYHQCLATDGNVFWNIEIIFKDMFISRIGQTSRYSYNDAVSINRSDSSDVAEMEYAQEVPRILG
ncbi:hypothetical protein Tco_0742624 [Tanacetum coccineum]